MLILVKTSWLKLTPVEKAGHFLRAIQNQLQTASAGFAPLSNTKTDDAIALET